MNKYIAVLSTVAMLAPCAALAVSVDINTTAGAHTTDEESDVGAMVEVEVGAEGGAKVETPSGVTVEVDRMEGTNAVVTIEKNISGDPDFDLFVQTVQTQDENVEAVDVDAEGDVEVVYEHEGRLFGFLAMKFTSRTSVETDTSGKAVVKVKLPWWSFLVSGASNVKTEIESSLSADARVQANAEADVTVDSRVKLVEVLVSSVAKADAAVKASYNVKANVK